MGQTEPEDLARTHHPEKPAPGEGGSPEPMLDRCGARLRKSDPPSYCMRRRLIDRPRCKLHGGNSRRGHAHPTYSGRGYTVDLPARLLDRLMEGLDDPNLTSMRTELALLDTRLGELLSTLEEGGGTEGWNRVGEMARRLRRVADQPDMVDREAVLDEAVQDLQTTCQALADETTVWREVGLVIDRRRRTANVELKREELEELTLRHSQALHFVQQILAVIHDEVPDEALKHRIAARIAAVLNRPEPARIGA